MWIAFATPRASYLLSLINSNGSIKILSFLEDGRRRLIDHYLLKLKPVSIALEFPVASKQ